MNRLFGEEMVQPSSILVWVILTMALLSVHGCLTVFKIPHLEPDLYVVAATDLSVTDDWRYGFVRLRHGAILVKTSARGLSGTVLRKALSEEVHDEMALALQLFPIKAILEADFYFFWVYLCVRVLPSIASLLVGGGGWRRPLRYALVAAFSMFIAVQPLLRLGYGGSFFTNLEGPGAISYTHLDPQMTFIQGGTISYRIFLEALAVMPARLALATHVDKFLPPMKRGTFLVWGGSLFYGVVGLLAGVTAKLASRGDLVWPPSDLRRGP